MSDSKLCLSICSYSLLRALDWKFVLEGKHFGSHLLAHCIGMSSESTNTSKLQPLADLLAAILANSEAFHQHNLLSY